MNDRILVREEGRVLTFRYPMLLAFHGGGFPGGVVHGLKAMQAAFPLLDERPPERRRILVATAFHGPGGRDAIEAVTRAATDGRLTVDRSIGAAGDVTADPPGPYVFRFTLGLRTVEAAIRPGHVREDFVRLGAKTDRTPSETAEHERLKREMAMRLLPLRGSEVYAVRVV
jgi:hypothetical protein